MKDTSGPAFPVTRCHFSEDGRLTSQDWVPGLTKREYAAIMALQGMIAYYGSGSTLPRLAIELADALLEELGKEGK